MPLSWRHLAGMLAAIVAPAVLAGLLTAVTDDGFMVLPVTLGVLVVAMAHVAILAIPLFSFLASRWAPALWRVLLASVAIGIGPLILIALFGWIASGFPDAAGLSSFAYLALLFGGFALSGGLAFWAVLSLAARSGSCR